MFQKSSVEKVIARRADKGMFSVRLNSDGAAKLLRYNLDNRRVRKALVEYLKHQIRTGEWQDDHPQPVVFSDSGRLIDGQHRLTAIVESELDNGQFIGVRVETGARDCVREYIDTGIPRTLEDRVRLHDDLRINHFAARIVNAHWLLNTVGARRRPSPDEARDYYAEHEESILWCTAIHKKERGIGAIHVALAATEYYERSPEQADEFYSDLFVPAGTVQQAQMLRDHLSRVEFQRSTSGHQGRRDVHAKSICCMRAHMSGVEVKRVLRVKGW